ncbi:MAG TPA: 23S rRNA (guanosine(2251)-2'-O)-methyltransferase RlmB [Vicinamibacterales bacterium]|nr:23S rRNA (guanosine(2251)-2'-O)-methyltransferase RlmB [Vicinamibacterales bacterium]
MLIYGIHAVTEALSARRVARLVHTRGAGSRVDALVARASELRIPIETLDRRALDKLTHGGVHQGVAAEVQAVAAFTVDELVRDVEGPPLLVVLDSVEDPQNVGAILRSVDAAGAHGVIRQARHSARLDGAAAKASAGAVDHVRIATVVNIARALEDLKELGVWTIGFDGSADDRYDEVDYRLPTAIVVGAEGTGLRRLVRETCDRVVSIPMAGAVSSLNVSVSAAVGLFEAARQRRQGQETATRRGSRRPSRPE